MAAETTPAGVQPPPTRDQRGAEEAGRGGRRRTLRDWFLRKPEIPEGKHNWLWGMERTGLDAASSARHVEMNEKLQADFLGVVFERYKIMQKGYTEPRPGEQRGGIQEFDVLAEHAMKQIFHENNRDDVMFDAQGRQYTEEEIIQRMERALPTIRLDILNDHTRNLAFGVLEATGIEMMAACGRASSDLVTREKTISGGVRRWLQDHVTDRIVGNDVLLKAIAYFTPGVPRSGPVFDSWKRRMKASTHVAFDPVDLGYDSTYMQVRRFGELDEVTRLNELNRVDQLRKAYLSAISGQTYHNALWMDVLDYTAENAVMIAGDFTKKVNFVNALRKVLSDQYPQYGGDFNALPREEKALALLQARREATSLEASPHIAAILQKAADSDFTDDNLRDSKAKLDGLKPREYKSTLQKKVDELTTAQTIFEEKRKALGKRISEAGDAVEIMRERNERLIPQRDAARATAADLTKSAEERAQARKDAKELDELVKQANERIKSLTEARDNARMELDSAASQVIPLLQGFAIPSAEYNLIVINPGPPPQINPGRLANFLQLKGHEAQNETNREKERLEKCGIIGSQVLNLLRPSENGALPIDAVLADFVEMRVPLTGTGSIVKPEEFAKRLRLNQEGVLPPERLAKLLVVHLGLDMDPNDIPKPGDDPAKFRRKWDEIFKAFTKRDGYAQAKVVLNVYNDRFFAIYYKGDPMADYLDYELPRPVPEMVPRRTDRQELYDALAADGVYAGVNAMVTQAGDYVVVAQNGRMEVRRRQVLADALARRETISLQDLGEMGLSLSAANNRIEFANPGTPQMQEARRAVLAADPNRVSQGLEMLVNVGNPIDNIVSPIDGIARQVTWLSPGVMQVTAGPEVAANGGIPIPLAIYLANAPNRHLDLEGAGRYYLDRLGDRSRELRDTVDTVKERGYAETAVDPALPPHELHWVDPDRVNFPHGSELIIDLKDPAGPVIRRREKDAAGNWVAAPADVLPGILPGDKELTYTELTDPLAPDDVKLLRRKAAAAAFNLLAQMTPEQRRRLALPVKGVWVTDDVLGLDGQVSVGVDQAGGLALFDQAGTRFNLLEILNRAGMENQTTLYHTQNPAVVAQVLANPNLAVQEALGMALWESLNRLNRR